MTTPLPGDFGVTATGGLAAKIIRWGTQSSVNHAFVCVGGGVIVEANPGGAALNHVESYPNAVWSSGHIKLTDTQRTNIAAAAQFLIGTPYGWADIVAIALAQRRADDIIKPDAPIGAQPWIVRRVQSLHTLICSQLVDLAYEMAGVELFADGRIPGLVSPGDLLNKIVLARIDGVTS